MKSFFRTLLAILRELADENAYARHLRVHNCIHSRQHWRRTGHSRLLVSLRHHV